MQVDRGYLRGVALSVAVLLLSGCAHTPASLAAVRVGIYSSAAADTAATYYALESSPGLTEANPLLASLVGRPAAFLVVQAIAAYIMDRVTRWAYARGAPGWQVGGWMFAGVRWGMAAWDLQQTR